MNGGKDIKDIVMRGEELLDEHDDLLKIVPYAKNVLLVYKWAKKRRIKVFLKSLSFATEEFDEKTRERFQEVINSELGAELLSEYVDSVLRTESNISNSALAILYSDVDNNIYSQSFKRSACQSLSGITDDMINYFMVLLATHHYRISEGETPYPIYHINAKIIQELPLLNTFGLEYTLHIVYVEELIRRRLLYPNYIKAIVVGEDFNIPYGIGVESTYYKSLFGKAITYLNKPG